MGDRGIGATNAHRLVHTKGRGYWCSAPGCGWRPERPIREHGSAQDQYRRHLYEIVPKGTLSF